MSRFNSRRSTLSQGYRKPLLYGFGILTILFLVSRRNVGDKGLPAVRADLNQSGAKVHSPVTGVAEGEEPDAAGEGADEVLVEVLVEDGAAALVVQR